MDNRTADTPPQSVTVAVYHNDVAGSLPYRDEHRLTAITTHLIDASDPSAAADWAYRTFNADLDMLQLQRHTPGGEMTFLAACVYRLLGHRSLSVGDVVQVRIGAQTHWLACDPFAWRPIDRPERVHGMPLSADSVHRRIAAIREALRS